MPIPAWASARIEQEVENYLAETPDRDPSLTEVVRRLRAWPVYGDVGGVLLLAADGQVYCRNNNTMEVSPEPNPGGRVLAWAAASAVAPELRTLLPSRPAPAVKAPAGASSGQCPTRGVGGAWGWVGTKGVQDEVPHPLQRLAFRRHLALPAARLPGAGRHRLRRIPAPPFPSPTSKTTLPV